MKKHVLSLPSGEEISSGEQGTAILSVSLTRSVNAGQELTLGSVCAAMAEIDIFNLTPGITEGDALTLYAQDEQGSRTLLGVFTAQKPEQSGRITRITAYDSIVKLDKDITLWLEGLDKWPYTLQELAHMVCSHCGLTLSEEEFPNGGYPVERLTCQGITGRGLMQYIGEIAGCYLTADEAGVARFGWYTPGTVSVVPTAQDGDLTKTYYYLGGLRMADYQVSPIEKLQLKNSSGDLGVVYPQNPDEVNTYCITQNPLLATGSIEALSQVAQTLFSRLQGLSYTPCTVTVPADSNIRAGQIVMVDGKVVYVMKSVTTGQKTKLSCVGSATRDSVSAVNERRHQSVEGRVLELYTDLQGIRAENRDAQGKLTRLEMDIAGIQTEAAVQQHTAQGLMEQVTALKQSATELSATVKSVQENGVCRVETQFGLTIDQSAVTIHRQGSEMTNRLNEKGMYVIRGEGTANETPMLRADADGVLATEVSVRNFLIIGSHARFEDYDAGRTACFYLEG